MWSLTEIITLNRTMILRFSNKEKTIQLKNLKTSKWTKKVPLILETQKMKTFNKLLWLIRFYNNNLKEISFIFQDTEKKIHMFLLGALKQKGLFNFFQNKWNSTNNSDFQRTGSLTHKFLVNTKFFKVFWNKDGEKCRYLKSKLIFQWILKKTILFTPTDLISLCWKTLSTTT